MILKSEPIDINQNPKRTNSQEVGFFKQTQAQPTMKLKHMKTREDQGL